MEEYQFSVSSQGKFLFRTEWESDSLRVRDTEVVLRATFSNAEQYKITKTMRNRITTSWDVTL